MTDENEALRRKVKQLERELLLRDSGGTVDPRKRALLDAGVPPDRLADAATLFRPSGNAGTGIFTLGDVTGPIDSLAREWLESRPWFGTPEPEAKPVADDRARIEGDRAIFPDGSSMSVALMSADDLLSMAGPEPKPKAPEPKPDTAYTVSATNDADYLPDIDKDWRAAGPDPSKRRAS
jgi:hypothetical protein